MSIGWKRGYYRCTLAENWNDYLLGKVNTVKWKQFDDDELLTYWNNRWVVPRLNSLLGKLYNEEKQY